MKDPTKDHMRVSPEGRVLGERMASLADRALVVLAAEGESDERCKSCAFTAGTVPNGCLQTQMDVMKAVVENVPFNCHQADRKGWPCHGWYAVRAVINVTEKAKGALLDQVGPCPWDFSPPDQPAKQEKAINGTKEAA